MRTPSHLPTSSGTALFGPGGLAARDEELTTLLARFRRAYDGLLEAATPGQEIDLEACRQRSAELEAIRPALSRLLGPLPGEPGGGSATTSGGRSPAARRPDPSEGA